MENIISILNHYDLLDCESATTLKVKRDVARVCISVINSVSTQSILKREKLFSQKQRMFTKRFQEINKEWKERVAHIFNTLPRRYRGKIVRLEKDLKQKELLENNIKIDYCLTY